jgi:hypothetical protein
MPAHQRRRGHGYTGHRMPPASAPRPHAPEALFPLRAPASGTNHATHACKYTRQSKTWPGGASQTVHTRRQRTQN